MQEEERAYRRPLQKVTDGKHSAYEREVLIIIGLRNSGEVRGDRQTNQRIFACSAFVSFAETAEECPYLKTEQILVYQHTESIFVCFSPKRLQVEFQVSQRGTFQSES